MVFYNPLCLEESAEPISLPSTGILYRKHFAISSFTFFIFILVILLQIISISTIKFLVNLNFLGKILLCLVDHLY